MADDIVEQLRAIADGDWVPGDAGVILEAAGEIERLRGGGAEQLDPKVEAACAAYLLAWPQMSEEAKRERRKRMRLALDAAAAERLRCGGEPPTDG
jgi:hypothetical protein